MFALVMWKSMASGRILATSHQTLNDTSILLGTRGQGISVSGKGKSMSFLISFARVESFIFSSMFS